MKVRNQEYHSPKVGIDLLSLTRFRNFYSRNSHLMTKVFTNKELTLPLRSIAGNFAAKEAVAKLGLGINFRDYSQIEILRDSNGAPQLHFCSLNLTNAFKEHEFQISISNEKDFVVAIALCL